MFRRLKFEILCHGVTPTEAALDSLPSGRHGSIIVRDFPTTAGLVMRLPGDLFVMARLRFNSQLALPLDHDGQAFFVGGEDSRVPVEVFPPAQYAIENRRLPGGKSIITVANAHADRVRLTPIWGCASGCQFCNYPSMIYRRNTIDELDEALRTALIDRILPPPHVLVSGGTPNESDYDYLNGIYQELPRRFPELTFDLMIEPRILYPGARTTKKYINFIRELRNCRFGRLSVNLELNSEEAAKRYMPDKYEIGRDDYLLFLELAVEEFGPGKVRSVLIVGLESEAETLEGVDALAERGVLVELSPFWADPGAFLAHEPEPTVEALLSVYERTVERTTRHGIPMKPFCIPCSHNIL